MGYYISSVLAISPTDTHAFFLYFIPSRRLRYEWVNTWIEAHFRTIAEAVGPHKGVIIAPSPGYAEKYLEDLLEIESQGALFSTVYHDLLRTESDITTRQYIQEIDFLHRGDPLMILSRTPLREDISSGDAVGIRLTGCKDEGDLGEVIDAIILVMQNNDMSILKALDKASNQARAADAVNKALELKPNFFGLGVNLNYILQRVAHKILSRLKGY